MEVRLQSIEMPECVHRIRGVEAVTAHVDEDGVLVHRLHLAGDLRILDYPADEWWMTISGVLAKRRDI